MSRIPPSFRRYRGLVDDWAAFVEACGRPLPPVVWANPLRLDQLRRLAGGRAGGAVGADEDIPPASNGSPPSGNGAVAGGCDVGSAAARDRAGRLLEARLQRLGLRCEPVDWYPGALRVPGFEKPGLSLEHYLGLLHVQEEVSLIPPVLSRVRPGQRVLDLCAAPGGKTAQLAVLMDNAGTLVANDVARGRLRALRANCERLGMLNVLVTRHDGTEYPREAGTFDLVLLDVPCSCEGNIRSTPGADWTEPDPFPAGVAGLQSTLLGRAWKLVRPGGVLVYATCTWAPEENELVLDHVLGDDAEIVPIRPSELPGLEWSDGVESWRGRELRADCRRLARFWPHTNDTGGFTAARIRKAGESSGAPRDGATSSPGPAAGGA